MSLKLHRLDAHLERFKDNLGACSEDQGELVHQDAKQTRYAYNGQHIQARRRGGQEGAIAPPAFPLGEQGEQKCPF